MTVHNVTKGWTSMAIIASKISRVVLDRQGSEKEGGVAGY